MKSLRAKVTPGRHSDGRSERRWQVDLLMTLPPGNGGRAAHVRNLSENGMMLETDAELAVGDVLQVDLQELFRTEAVVVWSQQQSFGCRFRDPVPTGVVSAAILRAPVEAQDVADQEPSFEEFPVGLRPTFGELAAWKSEFEQEHKSSGLRLIGFRQTDGGLLIAIAAKQA